MSNYIIRDYQKGFEPDQARIGREVARRWSWPYAFSLEDLQQIHDQPDFEPDTRQYCFLGDEMVGYVFAVSTTDDGDSPTVNLSFPRMMPGHEPASGLLLDRFLVLLKMKGVSRVVGRVTTMCPDNIRLAENAGFTISDWGYKVYYGYEMTSGQLKIAGDAATEVDLESDLDEAAAIAARWYKRPLAWCRARLAEWHAADIIAHVGVRQRGRLVAACMAAPNLIRPSTAAIYYIYAPDAHSLKPMVAKVVNRCIDRGTHDLIVDLIYEHRQYEPVYQELGFKKVAEWARCEKHLD